MSITENTIQFVKEKLKNAEAGHDWFHIERVYKNAKKIAAEEDCDTLLVEISALLHDIADAKFHNGDENIALEISRDFLETQNCTEDFIIDVLYSIKNISFKNREEVGDNIPIELQIIQDADRLDAIGAIGIARTFHFGGFKNNLLYDPEILPVTKFNKEEYKKSNGTTINHFYEKLLLLKDMMHTEKGKEMAEKRHQFMLNFLDEFLAEWD
ncbi:HD domain-containing protein [Frigoriflavimonas asaccharolytica]|uniref:HD/PDEase domain-containing protein n=1 Tax=Frigoriflavimonas asaccharolytica TaxID=2735899 RepID=A0A8J8KA88_9FLAO|nr:HD domain-containing protein [Frigoriflavimonas asaccharolytica]NRS91219.1 uncharacterized protein [Frigoriflavimonas asaccharolytica]